MIDRKTVKSKRRVTGVQPLILLAAFSVPVNGQQAIQTQPEARAKAQQNKSGAKPTDQASLDLIRQFATRAFAFEDPVAKVNTATTLADRAWSFDPPFARDLLTRTFYFAKELKPAEEQSNSAKSDHAVSKTQIATLRSLVLSVLTRRDPALAKRLTEQLRNSPTDSDLAQGRLLAARTLLGSDDVDQSVKVAEQSLRDGVQTRFLDYLVDLRKKDERAANILYQQTLKTLANDTYVDPMTLMYFGYYPFRVPPMSPDAERQDFRIMQSIGGVSVWNISADRSDVPPDVVRAYLTTASEVLSRPLPNPKQQRITYVTAYQLNEKAKRWAPDVVPVFSAIMQRLNGEVPDALQQPSTYEPYKEYKLKETADLIKEIDEVFGEGDHDRLCVTWVISFVDYERWADARKLAEKISALSLRSEMLSLVNYSEARKRLKQGELSFASEVAEKLPLSLARPLLNLDIAHRQLTDRDQAGAMASFGRVLKDARAIDAEQTPYLLLKVAAESSKMEPQFAIQTFNDAINLLNQSSGKLPRWAKAIEIQGQPFAQYNLLGYDEISGSEFATSINRLFAIDSEGTVATLMKLKHEQLLGRGLTTIASTLLNDRNKAASAVNN